MMIKYQSKLSFVFLTYVSYSTLINFIGKFQLCRMSDTDNALWLSASAETERERMTELNGDLWCTLGPGGAHQAYPDVLHLKVKQQKETRTPGALVEAASQ